MQAPTEWFALLTSVIQVSSRYRTLYHSTLLYHTLCHSTLLLCTVPYSAPIYSAVLYRTLYHSAVLYCTILCVSILYCNVPYSVSLHSTVLYCTVLYSSTYSALFYILWRKSEHKFGARNRIDRKKMYSSCSTIIYHTILVPSSFKKYS